VFEKKNELNHSHVILSEITIVNHATSIKNNLLNMDKNGKKIIYLNTWAYFTKYSTC